MLELTAEQQQALEAANDAPARVRVSGAVHVLLPARDYDYLRGLLEELPDVSRPVHPRTGETFALVPETVYERFKAFFEEDPLSREEQRQHLREAGRRAGWDDPEMDVYDEVYGDQP